MRKLIEKYGQLKWDKMNELFSFGNSKVPHLIINMDSAVTCRSKELGLCQLQDTNKCYAFKLERAFPSFHRKTKQMAFAWFCTNPDEFKELFQIAVEYIKLSKSKKMKRLDIRYVRFNVSGDFRNDYDISKLNHIAYELPDVTFYGYTARKDLFTQSRMDTMEDNIVLNGSGFMLHNSFTANQDGTLERGMYYKCAGDCAKCSICKVRSKSKTIVEMH